MCLLFRNAFLDQTVAEMGMDTGTLVGRRDGGLVDGTYVHENNTLNQVNRYNI
jgi:hypothetical protein